jgi:hypothetical protein
MWTTGLTLVTPGRPAALEADAQYALRAWWDGGVDGVEGVADVLYFDLAPLHGAKSSGVISPKPLKTCMLPIETFSPVDNSGL